MSFLDRRSSDTGVSAGDPAPPLDMHATLPAVCEYLCAGSFPDGECRSRSTITLMAGDVAGIKIVLNDRANGRSLWATGDGLGEALDALEVLLRQGTPPWRLDARAGGKKKS